MGSTPAFSANTFRPQPAPAATGTTREGEMPPQEDSVPWRRSNFRTVPAFVNDMEALSLKEEAQDLQDKGAFETALVLMKKSVQIRMESHTLCLSLTELAGLYVAMLKLKEAKDVCKWIDREAYRYDAQGQKEIARAINHDAELALKRGLIWGARVRLRPSAHGPNLYGILRGKHEASRTYYVDVAPARLLLPRQSFTVADDRFPDSERETGANDQAHFVAHCAAVLKELGGKLVGPAVSL